MKKLFVLVTIFGLLFSATLTLADTNLWSWIDNTGGTSIYSEKTTVSGWDYSEGLHDPGDYGAVPSADGKEPWTDPSLEETAYILEQVENHGNLNLYKALTSDGQWDLEEFKHIQGSGDTNIYKHVDVWTEDSRYHSDPILWYPTEAWVETEFETNTLWDADSAYFLMDDTPAQDDVGGVDGNHGTFNKQIETDDAFVFHQKVGINDFPSDYTPPEPPELVGMHWIN